ncbi:MAG TPA: universal stress protein [Acidimicrobiales bacterium]|nr:universal stress protein [Acidimicrobiales bacterium]
MARIVVGVDGSAASARALAWAVDEGRRRRATVEAVHAWAYPPTTSVTGLVPPPTVVHDDLVAEARAVLDAACDALGTDGAGVSRVLQEGPPAKTLLDRAAAADLLVVGSRGRGGFAGLLLGSVSQQCAHHARCPVVIVR